VRENEKHSGLATDGPKATPQNRRENEKPAFMKITVILCTCNRSQSLAKALESIAQSAMPDSVPWNVLVIDNNSVDDTRKAAQDFCSRFPNRFHYLFEPRQGKSYALNTALREADGDLFAFVDDDVVVDAHWLRNLTAPLEDRLWSGVGGRILPERGFTPPLWLDVNAKNALAPLAIFDLGNEAGELHDTPFGANMAFRKEMFVKHGGFRTDLGPRPGNEIKNEDSEFGSRLLTAGERFWYEPAAVVFHSVPAQRMRQRHFRQWWFDKARADIRQYGEAPNTRWYLLGVPLYLFRRLVVWTVRWIWTPHPARRFSARAKVSKAAGAIYECYHRPRKSNKTRESSPIGYEPQN
jgi:glucosyl-dolichyl phosphate glucuronosyltransferase